MKRKKWYKLHSILGLITGGLLFLIGLTGSLLIFAHEIDQFIWPDKLKVEKGVRLSLDEIRSRLNSQIGNYFFKKWRYNNGSNRPDIIEFYPVLKNRINLNKKIILINPVTGMINGGKNDTFSHKKFHSFILNFHYTLFLGKVGYFITGLTGICLIILALTGVYLYRNFWKNLFRLRFRQSTRILFSDLHKFVGITTVIFNIILGFTGAWWAIRSTIVKPLINLEKEEKNQNNQLSLYDKNISLNELEKTAKKEISGFYGGYISFPHPQKGGAIVFKGDLGEKCSLCSRYSNKIEFQLLGNGNYKIKKIKDIRKLNLGQQIYDSFKPLHFGTFAGLFSKILYVFVGLSPGILFISGSVISFSRKKSSKKPNSRG